MSMPTRSDKIFAGDLVTLFRSMDKAYRGVPIEAVAAFIAERYPPSVELKTINGESLFGTGDIVVSGSGGTGYFPGGW
jgi:hypothetical protein